MTRRIVLNDSEIAFFKELEHLSFRQQDTGLWIPPEGIALGSVSPINLPQDDFGGLLIKISRPNGNDVIRLDLAGGGSIPMDAAAVSPRQCTGAWYAVTPDNAIVFGTRQRLLRFQYLAVFDSW